MNRIKYKKICNDIKSSYRAKARVSTACGDLIRTSSIWHDRLRHLAFKTIMCEYHFDNWLGFELFRTHMITSDLLGSSLLAHLWVFAFCTCVIYPTCNSVKPFNFFKYFSIFAFFQCIVQFVGPCWFVLWLGAWYVSLTFLDLYDAMLGEYWISRWLKFHTCGLASRLGFRAHFFLT